MEIFKQILINCIIATKEYFAKWHSGKQINERDIIILESMIIRASEIAGLIGEKELKNNSSYEEEIEYITYLTEKYISEAI